MIFLIKMSKVHGGGYMPIVKLLVFMKSI